MLGRKRAMQRILSLLLVFALPIMVMAEASSDVADENSENLKPWLERVGAT